MMSIQLNHLFKRTHKYIISLGVAAIGVFWGVCVHTALGGDVFRSTFDRWDISLNNGLGLSTLNNFQVQLTWGESYIMMSYLSMYRGTGDIDYLKRFIKHAEIVIAQRDDKKQRPDFRNQIRPTWLTKDNEDGKPYA